MGQDELEAIARTCEQFCPQDTAYCGLTDQNEFVGASPPPNSFWLRVSFIALRGALQQPKGALLAEPLIGSFV